MSKELHGLCSTCCHVSVCVKQGTMKNRVFPCEDFLEDRRLPASFRRGAPKVRRKAAQASGGPFKGLCCDCENREGCCLAKANEGGVWHCEEYR